MGNSRSEIYTPFSIERVPHRDEVAVVVAGEIDLHTADEVAGAVRELWAAGWTRMLVDLHRVEFIDSLGLRMLIGLRNASHTAGSELSFVPPAPVARRVFELTSTDELFNWRERSKR